ncbi:thyroid peroxidase isoform X2 [Cynoglossus semilaevis]|uniref:thyroid peroxidase isoform X2 n=1 Tax=Cynoglossus semilaevis TaxID=244447 RepID=UPI0007DC88E2|nr:thyroid peroxidase isoform X2 [Cynoglossus semilaevis]
MKPSSELSTTKMSRFFFLTFHAVLFCSVLPGVPLITAERLNTSSITELILSSFDQSLRLINESRLQSRRRRSSSSSSSSTSFRFFRPSDPETLGISRAAEVFQTTVRVLSQRVRAADLLSWKDVELIGRLSQCPASHTAPCPVTSKYRSISGLCNNRENPLWGAAHTPLVRWLPAEYEDDQEEPKGWNTGRLYNGHPLPLPWDVSSKIMRGWSSGEDDVYSLLLVEWGQYLDHDVTFTPQSTDAAAAAAAAAAAVDCLNTCENVQPCFPIKVDTTNLSVPGSFFTRESVPLCLWTLVQMSSGLQGVESQNCSNSPGPNVLRTVPVTATVSVVVPQCVHGVISPQMNDFHPQTQDCLPFYRSTPACPVSVGAELTAVFQRQQMNAITSFIDASLIYGHTPELQSSLRDLRGFNGKLAVNQQFKDPKERAYLPSVARLPSTCRQGGQVERVECFNAGDSRANEGLPLMALHTLWLREHNRITETLKVMNDHWSPEMLYQETRKIVGALHQIITFRDYLPKIIGPESFEHFVGQYKGYDPTTDPSASNVFATAAFRFGHATIPPILRRLNESFQPHERFSQLRLHDTFFSPWRLVKEGYNHWRAFCGLQPVVTLSDLTAVVGDHGVAEKIQTLYGHLDNVDVWLGGLVEKPLPRSRTGPLFACLIGRQMKALRDGDRFWWEADGVFSQQQRSQLYKVSLSGIMCDNSDTGELPRDPFRFNKYPSEYVPCAEIPSMNLDAWREDKSRDLESCGSPPQIENGDFILSSSSGRLTALYHCHHGYHLTGNAAAAVCEDSQWTDERPLCKSMSTGLDHFL